jgi:hypothetical protein
MGTVLQSHTPLDGAHLRELVGERGRLVALEMRAGLHSLPAWLQPLPHICAIDTSHDTLPAIQKVFPEVHVSYSWMKMVFVAVAQKR